MKLIPCVYCDGTGKIDPLNGLDMELHIENRLIELGVSGLDNLGLRLICCSLKKTLGDAPNFVTMEVQPKGGPFMTVTIQRKKKGTVSPSERLREYEAKIRLLEERLKSLEESHEERGTEPAAAAGSKPGCECVACADNRV